MSARSAGTVAVLALALLVGAGIFAFRRAERPVPSRPPDRRVEEPLRAEAPVPSTPIAPLAALPKPAPPSRARSAFDRVLAALRSGDLGKAKAALEELRLELIPPPVPDAENAAILYTKAFELYPDGLNEEETELMGRLVDGQALREEERAKLRGVLDRNREALKLLHEAADRPRCRFNLDYSQGFAIEMPHVGGMIRGSRLLLVEAGLAEGAEAADASRAARRLADATAEEPILISQLVRGICHPMAGEALQLEFDGRMSRERLDSLVGELSPEAIRSGFEKTLLFELYASAKYVLDGGPPGLLREGTPVPRRPDDPLTPHDLAYFAETMSRYSELAGRPYFEVRDEIGRLEAERVEGAPGFAETTRLLLPSMGRAARRQATAEAQIGTAQLAAALRLYREERGSYPDSLEAVRGLLPGMPVDPFTGKPYLYRREGSGFVVYSVGDDLADGGGQGGETGETDLVFRSRR